MQTSTTEGLGTPKSFSYRLSSPSITQYVVVIAMFTLALGWTSIGSEFYRRVLPFYDSLSYQHEYHRILDTASKAGEGTVVASAWQQPSNTSLFLIFAAVFHPILANNIESFFLFFAVIHLAGIWVLVRLLSQDEGQRWFVGLAVSGWLLAVPFSLACSGVLDQRMDLSAASLFLVVCALALDWSRKLSPGSALLLGTAAAAIALHRPVMVVPVGGAMMVFALMAYVRSGRDKARMVRSCIVALVPIGVVALPWLIYHREYLQAYYLKGGYNVGNTTLGEAVRFNVMQLVRSIGLPYALVVLVPVVWFAIRRAVDWVELGAILLAGAVPVLVLIASRSAGNYGACLIPLGIPALAFACIRPGKSSRALAWVGVAGLVGLLGATGWSLSELRSKVEAVSAAPRLEASRMVLQIDEIPADGPRMLSGFNAWPLDVVGLSEIAREQGIGISAGIAAYHPYHFGIENAKGASVSEAEMRQGIDRVLEKVVLTKSLLILPSSGSEKLLPSFPFSHLKIRLIRQEIEADPRFVLVKQVGPISGCSFDVFRVRTH